MGLFNNDDYNKKLEEIEESFREERRNDFEKDLSEFDFSMPVKGYSRDHIAYSKSQFSNDDSLCY